MAGFYVVIAKGLGVILQIVDDLCGNVGLIGSDKVRIVAGRLALQDVAIV